MPEQLQSGRWILAIVASLLATACAGGDDSTVSVVTIGDPRAPFEAGAARLSATGQIIRGATFEGLLGLDEQGRVIPALADRWIITDDGQSYIFRLRDGTWPDGSAIDAASARDSLEQAIDALKGTPMALDLAGIDEIRVMAGRVIEIRLARAMPNLLQMLAQPELGMAWKGRGSGPMQLTRRGVIASLSPIPPQKRGLPAIADWDARMRTVRLVSLPADAAVKRFNDGDSDVLLGGRIESFPLAARYGISRGTIRLDPVSGLFGLSVVRGGDFLSAPENREATAMAIDRDGLIAAFGVGGWTPSTRIVAGGGEDDPGTIGERWAGLDLAARRSQAAARVARWRGGGRPAPRLAIGLPAGPGSDILYGRLSRDLASIGIETRRVDVAAAADLRLVDVVARYPRASWYLNQLGCAARRGLCSASADERAAEARASRVPAERAALLAEAEAELTSANVYIPFGAPIRWSLVRGDVSGFATNQWGAHPLMPMAERPR